MIDRFADYYRHHTVHRTPNFEQVAALEVQRRLRHLDFLLAEIQWRVELARSDIERASTPEQVQERHDHHRVRLAGHGFVANELAEQIEAMCESFYFHSHRLVKLLHKGPLPGFRKGRNPLGLVLVRNVLVEHYLDRSQQWPDSHRFDLSDVEAGPKLAKAEKVHADSGLKVNATEFRDSLLRTLSRLPSQTAPEGSPGTFGGEWWIGERERRIRDLLNDES